MTLVVLAVCWLVGFVAVGAWGAPWWLAGLWFALLAPLSFVLEGQRGAVVLAIGAVLAAVAGFRFEGWLDRPAPSLAGHVGRDVTIEAVVDSEPMPSTTTSGFFARVEQLSADGDVAIDVDGRVRLTVNQYTEWLPGDRLVLSGELEDPPVFEGFDYRAYLARQDVVATMLFPDLLEPVVEGGGSSERWSTEVGLSLDRALKRSLPEPEAAVAAGIVYGRDDAISRALRDDFRDSGLAHILAVSGSNVALVAAVVFALAAWAIGRYWAIIPAALTVAAYVALAGFELSVVRAAIMAGIALIGLWLGRPQSGMAALGAAAVLMTAWRPSIAVDVGFQLSLAATAGLIAFAPWIRSGLERARLAVPAFTVVPDVALQVMALSLAASIATLPISWAAFGRISLIGPVANIVVEPIFAIAFWLGGITAVAGLVSDDAGWAAGLVAYYPFALIVSVAEFAASLPGAAIDVPELDTGGVALGFTLLAIVGWLAYRRFAPLYARPEPTRLAGRVRFAVFVAAGAAFGAWIGAATFAPIGGPGELEVHVLDIGQGDAILVRTPAGSNVLVDGGPSAIELARELGAVLPHWQRDVNHVVLTHPQEDHIAGFPELFERFDVGAAFDAGRTNNTTAFDLYVDRGPPRRTVLKGDRWKLDGVLFEVFWPPPDLDTDELNDTSVVLRLTYREVTFLLTGDIERAPQSELVADPGIVVDVLKVPHHGAATSDDAFLTGTHAGIAAISAGAGNRFGHPREDTLAALEEMDVFRTDIHGRITIRSDGRSVEISTERLP